MARLKEYDLTLFLPGERYVEEISPEWWPGEQVIGEREVEEGEG